MSGFFAPSQQVLTKLLSFLKAVETSRIDADESKFRNVAGKILKQLQVSYRMISYC
jgi:predicted amino acid-binding ACT domain protein